MQRQWKWKFTLIKNIWKVHLVDVWFVDFVSKSNEVTTTTQSDHLLLLLWCSFQAQTYFALHRTNNWTWRRHTLSVFMCSSPHETQTSLFVHLQSVCWAQTETADGRLTTTHNLTLLFLILWAIWAAAVWTRHTVSNTLMLLINSR